MLLIDCPFCGERAEVEFRYAGEAHVSRPIAPGDVSDQDWARYLYERSNPVGVHAERWHHVHGCKRYFNALRETVSDNFSASYAAGTARPDAEGGR
jgi:sarcosine oxidase subunit delta